MTGGMERDLDVTVPNMARVYEWWLGGKTTFAADRELADRMRAIDPELPRRARRNREFVTGAAARAARSGISQFLDLGSGLPTHPAVHEAACEVNARARVVYIDHDAVVVSHTAALLVHGPGLAAVSADLTGPNAVLCDEDVRRVIDLSQPLCIILGSVLHFFETSEARRIVAGYAERIAPGSWVAVSVAHYADADMLAALSAEYPAPFFNHGAATASGCTRSRRSPPSSASPTRPSTGRWTLRTTRTSWRRWQAPSP